MSYTMEPHRWKPMKGISRDRCVKCGLLALRNKFSEWCARMGCEHAEHPAYKRQRDTLGGELK